jgi:hypothetical protein
MMNMMLVWEIGASGRFSPTSFQLGNIAVYDEYDAG